MKENVYAAPQLDLEKEVFKLTTSKFLKFFIPSMIGLMIFMFPIPYVDGKFVTYVDGFTIPVAVCPHLLPCPRGIRAVFWSRPSL